MTTLEWVKTLVTACQQALHVATERRRETEEEERKYERKTKRGD